MEEKIELIKQNLTGDYEKDITFLNSLYEEEIRIIEDANTTIEAINIIAEVIQEEVTDKETEETQEEQQEEIEEVNEEEKVEDDAKSRLEEEIDSKIAEVDSLLNEGKDDDAIKTIEEIVEKLEASDNKNDENTLYCSFGSEFEKALFEKLFAGEKTVKTTTYNNDRIYVIYAQLLISKNKRLKAMMALDRAIYWNFLNREARALKLELYLDKNSVTKYLETVKKLQKISYTPEHLADCYNKYAYIFNLLEDDKSAYAMYRISYSYYEDENVENVINAYEEAKPELKEMTSEEILYYAEENDVEFGPNANIIKAYRDITKEYVEKGEVEIAAELLRADYIMTGNDEIGELYEQLSNLVVEKEETQEDIPEIEDDVEEVEEVEEVVEEPKKKTTRKKAEPKAAEEKPKKKTTTKKASESTTKAKTTKTSKTTKKKED